MTSSEPGPWRISTQGYVECLPRHENYVDLELGQNVKVKALRSTIADVVSPTGTAAND